MKQDHRKLGREVKERRQALGISQREASEKAKRYDLECYPLEAGQYPGVSITAWADIERGKKVSRRAHTLALVDAVLRWPEGTSLAIATGQPLPEGEPVHLPSEMDGHHEDEGAVRVELARSREEVATLRREVAELHARVDQIGKSLERLLDAGQRV